MLTTQSMTHVGCFSKYRRPYRQQISTRAGPGRAEDAARLPSQRPRPARVSRLEARVQPVENVSAVHLIDGPGVERDNPSARAVARSKPIVVTCMWTAPSCDSSNNDHSMALRCREQAPSTTSEAAVSNRSKTVPLFDHTTSTWPLATGAQQPPPVIGFLRTIAQELPLPRPCRANIPWPSARRWRFRQGRLPGRGRDRKFGLDRAPPERHGPQTPLLPRLRCYDPQKQHLSLQTSRR